MIVVQTSHFPLVVHLFTGTVTHEEMVYHTQALEALFAKKTPFASVIAARKMEFQERARSMQFHAQWFQQHAEECRTWWKGVGFSFLHMVPRFLFASFVLLTRLPFPYETFANYPEALSYACSALTASNIALPDILPKEP